MQDMNERAEAIRILQKTREILAQRLTERILEAEEEILAEAEGLSFLSEIESIYDQIGVRLAHVNQMLNHLPAAEPAAAANPAADAHPVPHHPGEAGGGPSSCAAEEEALFPAVLALPAPGGGPTQVASTSAASLLAFAVHARRGDLFAAAASLETLFGLERNRSLASARVFAAHCQRDPSYFENAALLHNYLQADALSRAFGLMCEGLGLSGGEALSALMWWRTRAVR